ncbi:MAG: selenocysteine lyase, partial [Ignavibacterium sp.]|nr:selenocysteine lyase [Ignavibacterium sp.]
GTYGHYLLHVDPNRSERITKKIDEGDLSEKPGWVRLSLHPTMKDEELLFIIDAIDQIVLNINYWSKDYWYDKTKNEFFHKTYDGKELEKVKSWFELGVVETVED